MNKIHNILKMRFSQEILGGVLGMIVAIVLYHFGSALPSMQMTKGLLVDTSTPPASLSDTVRVNDATVDDIKLQRLAARAALLQKQQKESNEKAELARLSPEDAPQEAAAVSPEQAVIDRMDPVGQIAMREKKRQLASAFDLSVQEVQAQELEIVPVEIAQESNPVPSQEEIPVDIEVINTPLPDSGPVLNTVLFLTFVAACIVRRQSLIAMLERAH